MENLLPAARAKRTGGNVIDLGHDEEFNTYRFADYKEQVIDLLMWVRTISVETMKIVMEMP